jgi:hypothetical protein
MHRQPGGGPERPRCGISSCLFSKFIHDLWWPDRDHGSRSSGCLNPGIDRVYHPRMDLQGRAERLSNINTDEF